MAHLVMDKVVTVNNLRTVEVVMAHPTVQAEWVPTVIPTEEVEDTVECLLMVEWAVWAVWEVMVVDTVPWEDTAVWDWAEWVEWEE